MSRSESPITCPGTGSVPACPARRGCVKLAREDTPIEHLDLAPIAHLSGTVRLPGSKSISNRVLLLAALAHGDTLVRDLLDSDDTGHMLTALAKLGVSCAPVAGPRLPRGRRRRDVPREIRGAVHRQCGHRGAAAHRRAGVLRRPLSPLRRAAHARAADPRSRRRPARPRGRHRVPRQGRVPAARDPPRRDQEPRRGARARRRVEPVRHRAAHGAAAGRRRHDRDRRRSRVQALRRDDAQPDGALRRARHAHGLVELRGPRRVVPLAARDSRRGGRLVGLVLSRRRRDQRGQDGRGGPRGGGRPLEHPGRRAVHGGARAHGRHGAPRARAGSRWPRGRARR